MASVISCGLSPCWWTLVSRMLRFSPGGDRLRNHCDWSLPCPVQGDWLVAATLQPPTSAASSPQILGLSTIVFDRPAQRYGRGMNCQSKCAPGVDRCTVLAAISGQASFRQVPATPWIAMAHPLLLAAAFCAVARPGHESFYVWS